MNSSRLEKVDEALAQVKEKDSDDSQQKRKRTTRYSSTRNYQNRYRKSGSSTGYRKSSDNRGQQKPTTRDNDSGESRSPERKSEQDTKDS